MRILLTAIASILFSVGGQFALKAGMSGPHTRDLLSQPLSMRTFLTISTEPYVLTGLLLYVLGAVVWLAVLSRWDVSKAYPLTGLGFAMAVGIGFALGEQLSVSRVAGVALICAGVALVARS